MCLCIVSIRTGPTWRVLHANLACAPPEGQPQPEPSQGYTLGSGSAPQRFINAAVQHAAGTVSPLSPSNQSLFGRSAAPPAHWQGVGFGLHM
jgi:hypothetical protein